MRPCPHLHLQSPKETTCNGIYIEVSSKQINKQKISWVLRSVLSTSTFNFGTELLVTLYRGRLTAEGLRPWYYLELSYKTQLHTGPTPEPDPVLEKLCRCDDAIPRQNPQEWLVGQMPMFPVSVSSFQERLIAPAFAA